MRLIRKDTEIGLDSVELALVLDALYWGEQYCLIRVADYKENGLPLAVTLWRDQGKNLFDFSKRLEGMLREKKIKKAIECIVCMGTGRLKCPVPHDCQYCQGTEAGEVDDE